MISEERHFGQSAVQSGGRPSGSRFSRRLPMCGRQSIEGQAERRCPLMVRNSGMFMFDRLGVPLQQGLAILRSGGLPRGQPAASSALVLSAMILFASNDGPL